MSMSTQVERAHGLEALHGVGEHDDRDWSAIRAWSVDLAKALETSTTPATIQ
jgi:hypothetical protein